MIKTFHRCSALLLVIAALLGVQSKLLAQDTTAYTTTAKVARISLIQGDVSFQHSNANEWELAALNYPLTPGDKVYTGDRSRAEIQMQFDNYIRLNQNTTLAIDDLTYSAAHISILSGTATFRINHFEHNMSIEVGTPAAAVILTTKGLYRINIYDGGDTEILVRDGAATVTSDGGTVNLKRGRRIIIDGSNSENFEVTQAYAEDEWDRWNNMRDEIFAQSRKSYEYINRSVWGVSDLDDYGYWIDDPSYGRCWIPRTGHDWAPYTHGRWIWNPLYGWTWLSYEPWGWAPYHFGRWTYISRYGWAWIPGPRHVFQIWAPALVTFVRCKAPSGNYVGWYPLAPGEQPRATTPYVYGNINSSGGPRTVISRPPDSSHSDSGDRPGRHGRNVSYGLIVISEDDFINGKVRGGISPREVRSRVLDSAPVDSLSIAPTARSFAPRNQRPPERAIPPSTIADRPVITTRSRGRMGPTDARGERLDSNSGNHTRVDSGERNRRSEDDSWRRNDSPRVYTTPRRRDDEAGSSSAPRSRPKDSDGYTRPRKERESDYPKDSPRQDSTVRPDHRERPRQEYSRPEPSYRPREERRREEQPRPEPSYRSREDRPPRAERPESRPHSPPPNPPRQARPSPPQSAPPPGQSSPPQRNDGDRGNESRAPRGGRIQ